MGWIFFLPLGILMLLLGGLLRKYWYSPPKALAAVLGLSFLPIIYLLVFSKIIRETSYEVVFDMVIMRSMLAFMFLAFIGGTFSLVSLTVYGIATLLKRRTH